MKRMNSLPLSPVLFFFTRPYRENRYLQVLRNTVALSSYLGPFALCNFFYFYNNLTRVTTLCLNILNAIRKLA